MPNDKSGERPPATVRDFRLLQVLLWCVPLLGLVFIFTGIRGNHRDRPSLKWPIVQGMLLQAESYITGGKHRSYHVAVTYTYILNGRRYMGHQVKLWNPTLSGSRRTVDNFLAENHPHMPVDVHYDPQHPENAVLIPGPDEFGNNISIWCGALIFAAGAFLLLRCEPVLSKLIVKKKAEPPPRLAAPPEKSGGLPHGFVSYEPGCKRKLNCFPDKECLLEVLGHDGEALQDWTAEDRVIDSEGRVYRLVKRPGKKRYDIDATGESWSCEKLLDVAVADTRLLNKDSDALRRRVGDVPAEQRIAVLMKCIDDLPAGPPWAIIGLIAFLVLFFFGVMFITYKIATHSWK